MGAKAEGVRDTGLPTSVKSVLSRETLDPREKGGVIPKSFQGAFTSLASRNKGLRPLPVLLVEDSFWKKNE